MPADVLGGTLLTVEGERHTVGQQAAGSPCVNDVVARAPIDLDVSDPDRSCPL